MESFKGKYIRTYLWSGLSLLLSFLSMFIVAPLTTNMPEAYGVYSLCISYSIFLQYADLGFINAGKKYAAEAFSVNNKELEKRYVRTAIFIYGIMSLILFSFALFISKYPEYIIKGIGDSPYYETAHQLLFILAITFPLSIIQKFCNVIYSIRIEDYRIQRILIIGSVLKIVSVPVYFFNNRYNIVGYYLFCEITNFLVYAVILINSKKIGYGIKELFRCFKFDAKIFREIMPLALSGFASTIGWIFYYELDTIGISILLGANAVAIYAIGKQIQSFVRSLVGIVFSPYPTRINYYIGQKDYDGLRVFFHKLAEEFCFITIPVIAIILYANPFVKAWVGTDYIDSCIILQLLVSTFIISYVSNQGNAVLYGLNKVKDLLVLSVIKPVFFWVGILLTYRHLGVVSFALMQLIACIVTELYCCFLTRKYLGYGKADFYWSLLAKPLVVISSSCLVFWLLTKSLLLNVEKSHGNLLFVASVMAACCIFALCVNLCFNPSLREEVKGLLSSVFSKK